MKVVQLKIDNFRGIESAELKFDGHALLVGSNNVGKSTICEALDLVLGPDRLNRFPPIEEYDFYNGKYLTPAKSPDEDPEPIKIRVEVLLTELSSEVQKRCGKHLEFWHIAEKRLLTEGEVKEAAVNISIPCLRLETVGQYDPVEDEFSAETLYTHSPDALDGVNDPVRREIKRLFGFLYLRALRTGIFAMEEPEIAVQPHTQRRIADYLLIHTKQAFVTSHSPYVIERFTPENTFLLTRATGGKLETMCVADATGLKENDYKRYARKGLAECMLGKGVIIVEGATELHALPVLARCLEASDTSLNPLDLAGVSVFDAESDGPIPKFAKFFQALGLKTFGFYDAKNRPVAEKAKFAAVLDVNEEHPYKGFEELLSAEIPVARLRSFLQELLDSGIDAAHYKIPTALPADDTAIRKLIVGVLSSSKGAGWAARLLEQCNLNEYPKTAVDFLKQIYGYFPVPTVTPATGASKPTP
jgi:predicted ATP-dependent endonuclease of OLD family